MALESLKLNSAPSSLFVNPNEKDERRDLVCGGRLILAETHAKEAAKVRKDTGFVPRLNEADYRKTNEELTHKTLMFCAKVAAANRGENPPESYSAFLSQQRKWLRDSNFLRALSGIVTEVIAPLLPYTTSNALGALAFVDKTPIGKTYEARVLSNDVFLFQDSSWGASRSVPKNTLYDANIAINPIPRTAAAHIKWYQLVGNQDGGADIGRYYLSLAGGSNNKILGLWNNAITSAASSAQFVPSYLRKTGYTTANWISLAKSVSQANGIPRDRIMAYGDWTALAKVLPSGTAQDAALSTLLGEAWFSRGFLGTAMGVPMAEITNAYVAGTVNNPSPAEMLSTSTIYMAASAGEAYAPVYIIFEDDPIVLELDPSQTGDESIDVNMTISVGVAPVCGSKIGVMSSVS